MKEEFCRQETLYKVSKVRMRMVCTGDSRKANIRRQEWGREKRIGDVARE